MKILHVIDSTTANGAMRLATSMAEAWRTRGHEVQLVCVHGAGGEVDALLPAAPTKLGHWVQAGWALWQLLRHMRPTMVMTYGPYAEVLAVPLAMLAGVKLRVVNGLQAPAQTAPALRRWQGLWMRLGLVPLLVVHSVKMQKNFAHVSTRVKVRRVPLGVHWELPARRGAKARAQWQLPAKVPLLLCVGQLEEVSRPQTLLRALVELPDVHAVLVGAGSLEEEIRATAMRLGLRERLHLLASIAPDQMPSLMAAVDVLVDASAWDSPSLVPVEAAMSGLPLLLSDTAAHRELVQLAEDYFAAAFFSASNPTALAECVRTLLSDPKKMDAAQKQSAKLAKRYDMQVMMAGYVEVMAEGMK